MKMSMPIKRGILMDIFLSVVVLVLIVSKSTSTAMRAKIHVYPAHWNTVSKYTTDFQCDYAVETAKPLNGSGAKIQLTGGILNSDPPNACDTVPIPPQTWDSFIWILLATQSGCDFKTKLRHAQNAGYSALILYDDISDWYSTLPFEGSDVDPFHIFSCFTEQAEGRLLHSNFTYMNGYEITISEEERTPMGYVMMTFALILVIALVLACCASVVWVWLRYSAWPRITGYIAGLRFSAKERRRVKRNLLFASALKELPTEAWSANRLSDACAICMDQFRLEDQIRQLQCGHGFHPNCIDEWLVTVRRYCPLCERKVTLNNQELYSNTDSDSDEGDMTPLLSHPHSDIRTYHDDYRLPGHSQNPSLDISPGHKNAALKEGQGQGKIHLKEKHVDVDEDTEGMEYTH